MKKKTYSFIFVIYITAILLGGCGLTKTSYPKDARGVVNAFLGELIDGDLEGALIYCDMNGDAYQMIEPITEKNMIHELALSLSLDEEDQAFIENNKYIQKLIHSYYEYMYKNYQIIDVYDDKDESGFNVGINKINLDSDSIYVNLVGSDLFLTYYNKNQETLDAIYEEQGENKVMMRFIKDKGKEIVDIYLDFLHNYTSYSIWNYYITLKKIGGEWKVTSFQ